MKEKYKNCLDCKWASWPSIGVMLDDKIGVCRFPTPASVHSFHKLTFSMLEPFKDCIAWETDEKAKV